MSLTVGSGRVARLNPLAAVGASIVLAVPLVLTLDWVSASVALVVVLILTPLAGLPLRALVRRSTAVLIAAPLTGITIALYGKPSGSTYLHWALVDVTHGSLALAVATTLRVLAIGIPAIILFTGIDATALADALAQRLRLPARFVLGALAAVRLVGLIAEDWQSLARARRARGVADRAPVRRFLGQAFALLVVSLRRATELATAMEARGFGAPATRTWARPSRFGPAEWLLIGLAAATVLTATIASVATGHWRFVGA